MSQPSKRRFRLPMKKNRLLCPVLAALLCAFMNQTSHGQEPSRAAYEKAVAAPWRETFRDSGTADWKENWFLDGKQGTVTNSPKGMRISAGPVEHDDASHVVLWTRRSFDGAVRLEFDYTRTDSVNRWVNIVYIQATGIG